MTTPAPTLWETAKRELALQLTPDIYEMYIHPTTAVEEGDSLVLTCPNTFVRDWLEQRLNRVIAKTASFIAGRELTIRCVLSGQALLFQDAGSEAQALVRPGELRPAGFVTLWHDLRTLYGPKIGLVGVGLWAEFRAAVQADARHPLCGYAWIGLRALIDHYVEGRIAVQQAIAALKAAGLIDWQTGSELAEIWERNKAAGLPDRENPGVSPQTLNRLLGDPINSRIYSVSDPLELPAFCCRFDLAIQFNAETGACSFESYAGRLTSRWQDWLRRLMAANALARITPADWQRLGLQ